MAGRIDAVGRKIFRLIGSSPQVGSLFFLMKSGGWFSTFPMLRNLVFQGFGSAEGLSVTLTGAGAGGRQEE